ncbi:hypothetical protein COHA_004192 [Chlorella ohadii]|uniref:Fungal lipase-type domain-containing protein n=1 Tax=Chlorella ohadii TaxID=2649997 RepID=A0AAD5DTL0_9CHLO|nr:hypothetical protein COHA_004192 [Chlorella ohadii]
MRRAAARLLLLVAAVGAATAARSCVPPPGLLDVDPTGCCLDQPPMIDAGSSPAFISGVLAHFAYPTSFSTLSANCSDACVDFQAPFTELAKAFGAEDVAFVNGADDHLNAMIIQTNDSVWLVFRGTEWPTLDPVDILQDAKVNLTNIDLAGNTAGVHSGMWADLGEVFPALTAQLDAYGAGTERNLIITGHSLGATLSGLTAARLAADGRNVSAVYTWASSRPGDERFAEAYRKLGLHDKTLRFSAQGDVVPLMLPPSLLGYHHVGQLVHIANGTCAEPDAVAEQVDYCAIPGLTRATASEPGLCRDTLMPYIEQFCATPVDKLGGKNELEVSYNLFMWDLICKDANSEATMISLQNDPSWCCLFEYAYQLVGGVLEDLVMQVGMQHGMPNYLTYADACVNSGDAAEQVIYCMENNRESAAVFNFIEGLTA